MLFATFLKVELMYLLKQFKTASNMLVSQIIIHIHQSIEGTNEEDDIPLSMLFKELDYKMDITENVPRYIDFHKDVSTSPDTMYVKL